MSLLLLVILAGDGRASLLVEHWWNIIEHWHIGRVGAGQLWRACFIASIVSVYHHGTPTVRLPLAYSATVRPVDVVRWFHTP